MFGLRFHLLFAVVTIVAIAVLLMLIPVIPLVVALTAGMGLVGGLTLVGVRVSHSNHPAA
jgi:uncharacterized membrane protein